MPLQLEKPVIRNHGILHQTQPNGTTCVQTCIAMALGVPVENVIARYGNEGMNQQKLCAALSDCGVVWNQFAHGAMVYEGWYFVTVPSLNHRRGNHQILVHFSTEDGLCVLDPARGERYEEDGSDLISWSYLTPFWLGGMLPPTTNPHPPTHKPN